MQQLDGGAGNPRIVGERGAALALMSRLGLPVPEGFTLTTDAWRVWKRSGGQMPPELAREFRVAISRLVRQIESEQPAELPVLLAVRPASPVRTGLTPSSTLNLGLTAASTERLAQLIGPHAWVMLEELANGWLGNVLRTATAGITILDARGARSRAEARLAAIGDAGAQPLPAQLSGQVRLAVEAAWRRWDPELAYEEEQVMIAPRERGIAVVVQRVIFGRPTQRSGNGRLRTRDPRSGRPGLSGRFTPSRCRSDRADRFGEGTPAAARLLPPAEGAALTQAAVLVESAYRDMCEISYRIEDGSLWMLDAGPGERQPPASIVIAVDMVEEGLIELEQAYDQIALATLDRLQRESENRLREAGEPQLSRLLGWCEEGRRIPVRAVAPRGWPVVRSQQDARRQSTGPVLIDVPAIGPYSSQALQMVVRTALARGATAFALRLGPDPIERDLRLPRAPWQLLVAPTQHRWAASLLAARTITVDRPTQ